LTDTANIEIYTLSLHDALPISRRPFEMEHGEGSHGKGKGILHRWKKAKIAQAEEAAHEVVAGEAPAAVGIPSPDDDSEATVADSSSGDDASMDQEWEAAVEEEEEAEEAPQVLARPGREVGLIPLLFIFPLFFFLL